MVGESVMALTGLGLLAATVLAIASRVFYVKEDPRVEEVMDALPGANCGGCGYAGCEGYAIAVVNDPSVDASLCVAGGADVSIAVGNLTGKTVAAAEPLTSFRRCDKVGGHVSKRYDYKGMPDCSAAASLSFGVDKCKFSCLGYGTCVSECAFGAMHIEEGILKINSALCTGCGKCIKVCPRDILELIPKRARVALECSTKEKLKLVMDVCEVGCIHCLKCIKVCPAKALSVKNERIIIDQKVCLAYGPECKEACVDACPRKILRNTCSVSLSNPQEANSAEEQTL